MEFVNEYGGCITVIILLIAAAVSYPSLIGGWFLAPFERKPKQKRVPWKIERERIADDLYREYPHLMAPENDKQAARFAKIASDEARRNSRAAEDANYNRNIRQSVLWTIAKDYISAEGHRVDAETNKIIEYNVAPRRE